MKLAIGFITYGDSTAKYLPYFLPSIFESSIKDFEVFVIDNSEKKENANKAYIQKNYKDIDFQWAGENIGFSRAYNKMIRKAVESGAEYFLMLNPDMIIEPGMIEKLVTEIEKDDKIGVTLPRTLIWDFENKKKTEAIDSLGVYMSEEHRFDDIKDEKTKLFGFTGAAALLKVKALNDIKYENEFFDELMFMYKEDCDMSYRLRLAGWDFKYVSDAICYHDRTADPLGVSNFKIAMNRFRKSKNVKRWSFLNQWIIVLKYLHLPFSFKIKIKTYWYQLKSLMFVLFFEQFLFKEFITLWRIRKKIKEKGKALKIKVQVKEIEKNMN